jgi:predicted Zn-dependent protease
VTGKSEMSFVSEATEIATGQEQYLPSQQSQGGLYRVDKGLTQYVNEVGQRIARLSDRTLPYEFVVLNNSIPNAWALPGGKIAINRGLLLKLSSEAELAAVLGHEIVHSAARHGAKSMERGALLQGAIMATSIGISDSDYGNYIVDGAELGAQLLTHRYGRSAELESDYYGIPMMIEPLVFQPNAQAGGYMVDGDAVKITHLVRQAVELGADVIKADPTDDVSLYHKVIETAGGIPVLVRGGGKVDDETILKRTQGLLEQGASGIVYGRNVIQHDNPTGITRALMAMLHDGASVTEALALIGGKDKSSSS